MKRLAIFVTGILLLSFHAVCQTYILNEDFSGASGTNPPTGWTNETVTGSASDLWHFDNPGGQIINFPVTEPFAIFDSEAVSANGQPEEAALGSPTFDASVSDYILLQFNHFLEPGNGATCKVQAFDGDAWQDIAIFNNVTANPASELLDLSDVIGGVTNARIRFLWSGNSSGFWAVDNIRIYASLALDGGVVSVDSPAIPVPAGVQDVIVTLGNFGYQTISSTTIEWTANGVSQPQYNWNGTMGFGQTQGNIVIGSYNFQGPVLLKIWQRNPNGQTDPNPYNDTITKYLTTALCGTYTIGGTNPDFNTFGDVADVLNSAGITCAVTFQVRDGVYSENLYLHEIPGASATHTVTFQSQSGNNTQAVLQLGPASASNEPVVFLDGTRHVKFRNLGFITGNTPASGNYGILMEGAENIVTEGCRFESGKANDIAFLVEGGSRDITLRDNEISCTNPRARAVSVRESGTTNIEISDNIISGGAYWENKCINVSNLVSNVQITGNEIQSCSWALYVFWADQVEISGNHISDANFGVFIDNLSTSVEVSANRILNVTGYPEETEGTSGIRLNNVSGADLYNNFIQSTGNLPVSGIRVMNSSGINVHYNSVNGATTDLQGNGTGLSISGSENINAYNNIFYHKISGIPVKVESTTPLDLDYNDYYSYGGAIGSYEGIIYNNLDEWTSMTGGDLSSQSVHPFFSSETNLSMNQALLNNAGTPVPGITMDIDGTTRNPSAPDIGAKEHNLCSNDAGINAIVSPENPLAGGPEQVSVLLQNQGTNTLTSVTIQWEVNGQAQSPFLWSGSVPSGQNTEVAIGTFNFQSGEAYIIKAMTTVPNGTTDCNHLNDTITSRMLAVPLCGTYTIGGANPDFENFSEAAAVLNTSGVSCATTFLVRDGVYQEKIRLGDIMGSSATHTVTFRSQSSDSTAAILEIIPGALEFDPIVHIDGSEYITFRSLGFRTGTDGSNNIYCFLVEDAHNIWINRCDLRVNRSNDMGIVIRNQSETTRIEGNRIECVDKKAGAIGVYGNATTNTEISGNHILGATEWGYMTIDIGDQAEEVQISQNQIEGCNIAVYMKNVRDITVRDNRIENINFAIYVDNPCNMIEVSGNRIHHITGHDQAPQGTSGILVKTSSNTGIFNNYIHASGDGAVVGITFQGSNACYAHYNSINLANNDPQAISKGLYLTGNSGITGRNNIFNIMNAGTPVYIDGIAQQIELDHNDYYSFDETIGFYDGIQYTDITSWAAGTGMDGASVSVNPFYSSETDLTINQIILNNSGEPVAGITTDIDGKIRSSTTPDIGAWEYDPCGDDAGINAIIAPKNPLSSGLQEVRVVLQNQGTNTLENVDIAWSVNDEIQTPYPWSGTLVQKGNAEVNLGEYQFEPGFVYVIRAWTEMPNSTTDCNHENDTSYSQVLSSPLCGDYTIGGEDADYESFGAAATVLNQAGISCPVRFIVRDGIYHEKFNLGQIPGTSTENTVTFLSESGDSTLAVMTIDAGASYSDPMIILDGTSHVKFERLGMFTGTSSGNNNFVMIMEKAHNIELEGCYIRPERVSDVGIIIRESSTGIGIYGCRFESGNPRATALIISGEGTEDIEVTGNMIDGATASGYSTIKVGPDVRLISVKENFLNGCYQALSVTRTENIEIRGNQVNNSDFGIHVDAGCQDVGIIANRLTNINNSLMNAQGTYGIYVNSGQKIDLINNYIHATGQGIITGIRINNSDTCRMHFNSINLATNDIGQKSKCTHLTSVRQLNGRNNIQYVKTAGIPIHLQSDPDEMILDYNDYYSPSGIIGRINDDDYTSISQWGSAINGDANSLSVDAFFKVDTVPLPYQRALNGAGIPVSGIIDDINGIVRNSQAPDIGCYEFLVDIGITELLSPTLECFHPFQDSVTVYIKKFGDLPFEDIDIAMQMDDGPVKIESIPGTIETDMIHTFDTIVNISEYGDYHFKFWLIGTLDDNINNDTLDTWRYSRPVPTAYIEWDNFCTGREVHFFGSATVPPPGNVGGYEWLFGDGATSEEQNPVHTFEEPGTYEVTLRAYTDAGCYNDTTESIYIEPGFEGLSFNLDIVPVICMDDNSGSITINASGGYPPYNYFLNGTQLAGNGQEGLGEGSYEVMVVDSENCTEVDTVVLVHEVNMNPQIIASPVTGQAPLEVSFNFTAEGAGSWTWYFSEDVSDTNKTTSYTFEKYGSNIVTLEVNSGAPYYCTETTTVEIWVDVEVTIEPNNIFTPNDDGYNDYFEVYTLGVEELTVNIFNQWGNKLHVIEAVGGRWDGTTEGGQEAPDGTYFYDLRALDIYNMVHQMQGTVMLVRHGAYANPNPVQDQVRIKTFNLLTGEVEISVYSTYGQLVMSEIRTDPQEIILDLSHLKGGVYLIRLTDGKENNIIKIIKN